MKKLLTTIALFGIVLTGVAQSQNRQEPVGSPDDAKDLQGEWQAVDRQVNGCVAKAGKNGRSIFQGDRLLDFNFGSGNLMPQQGKTEWRFSVDPARSPKEIDIVISRPDQKSESVTIRGIYLLEGGRLTICKNSKGKRPTDFKTADGDGNVLEVYERVGSDPSATLEFAKIQNDFAVASAAWWEALGNARTGAEKRRLNAERSQTFALFADRYLKFAEAHPDGFAGLASLCRAAFLAPASASGTKALAILNGGRVAQADLNELQRALSTARNSSAERAGQKALAPQVLACVKRQLDHPDAAQTLTWVSTCYPDDQSTNETFAECADLIVGRFAGSPDIFNFCETLGTQNVGPAWGAKVEQFLRTILDQNTHRFVRSCASFALASAVQNAGENRQDEAERLYRQFITDFTDNANGPEQLHLARAKVEIEEIRLRGLGKPAPELVGEDLDGRPMKLADFRDKVVLVSFWATWCGPCMRMVPHEKSLAKRLENKPFVLVGVNGDREPEELKKGIEKHEITWRSFKDKLDGKPVISDAWKIPGWPTLYLIDQNGIVRKRWTDTVPPEVLNREIDDLIATGAP